MRFGREVYGLDGLPFTVVQVNVPPSALRLLYRMTVDGRPTAVVEECNLAQFNCAVTFEFLPALPLVAP